MIVYLAQLECLGAQLLDQVYLSTHFVQVRQHFIEVPLIVGVYILHLILEQDLVSVDTVEQFFYDNYFLRVLYQPSLYVVESNNSNG